MWFRPALKWESGMSDTTRIRIGNQTSFASPSVTAPFEYAVLQGFDAFEWFPDKKESGAGWAIEDMSRRTRDDIKKTALDHDMCLSVHAPWEANPLHPSAKENLFRQAAFAEEIGASLMNIHLYVEQGIEAYLDAISALSARLKDDGIGLSLENTIYTSPSHFNDLFGRLRRSERYAHVGMCFDVGHANLFETTRNDYLRFMDLLDPHVPIIHVHLHENYGDSDSHLTVFTGPSGKDPSGVVGVMKRLKKRHFSGSIILEQWPDPPSLLKDARDRLFEIMGRSPSAPSGRKKDVGTSSTPARMRRGRGLGKRGVRGVGLRPQ
jgi:sugar phosphate isomerase/epimerase